MSTSIQWIHLKDIESAQKAIAESHNAPVFFFKHSNTCHISNVVKSIFESDWKDLGPVKAYFIDVLNDRPISNFLVHALNENHESPQLLLVKNGECTYEVSHQDITFKELSEMI